MAINPYLRGYRTQNLVALGAKVMVCFRGIGNEENYQDLLANAAKHCLRESETTCSAARTTRVWFKRVGISLFIDEDRFPWVFP
jgi:hypothetical protein